MAEVTIKHVFHCSEDTFWDKVFFDEEYNRRMFKEALEFPVYEMLKNDQDDNEVRRSINVVPKLGPMPGPLKAVVGEGLGYREDGVYDKKTRVYSTVITPNKLAEKMKIKGKFTTRPKGDNELERIFECSVTAKIFGVGGMLEKRIISDMETSYDKAAEFTNEWIKEKGL
jgi:Protein of unknown function (DUF2505)